MVFPPAQAMAVMKEQWANVGVGLDEKQGALLGAANKVNPLKLFSKRK